MTALRIGITRHRGLTDELEAQVRRLLEDALPKKEPANLTVVSWAESASSTLVSASGFDPDASSTRAPLYVSMVRVLSGLCTVRIRSSRSAPIRLPSGAS